jgi:hypothetical protein
MSKIVCLQATHKLLLRYDDNSRRIPGTAFSALEGHSLAHLMGEPRTENAVAYGTVLCSTYSGDSNTTRARSAQARDAC